MVNIKSFSDIVGSERNRKRFYRDAIKNTEEKLCSCCKQKIINNAGPSRVNDICNNCVSKALKDNC